MTHILARRDAVPPTCLLQNYKNIMTNGEVYEEFFVNLQRKRIRYTSIILWTMVQNEIGRCAPIMNDELSKAARPIMNCEL